MKKAVSADRNDQQQSIEQLIKERNEDKGEGVKTILLILGLKDVDKSEAAQVLLGLLPHSVLVDSDWCRVMNPYHWDT